MNAHPFFLDRCGCTLEPFTRLEDLPAVARRHLTAAYAKVLDFWGPLPPGVYRVDSSTFVAFSP